MDKLWRCKNCKTCVNATCIEGKGCVMHVLKFPLVAPTGVVLGMRCKTVLPWPGVNSSRVPRVPNPCHDSGSLLLLDVGRA